MNKEYFITGKHLVVLDDEGNIRLKNRPNNPQALLERENRLEQINKEIAKREELIFAFPKAISKKEQSLAELDKQYKKYVALENKIKEAHINGNLLSLLISGIIFANQSLVSSMFINFGLEVTFLFLTNYASRILKKNVWNKQKSVSGKMDEINELLGNYQTNLTKIKEETYHLNYEKESIRSNENLPFLENAPLKEGVIYHLTTPDNLENVMTKEQLEKQKNLLQTLAHLLEKDPDILDKEILNTYPDIMIQGEDLSLKLFKKDL